MSNKTRTQIEASQVWKMSLVDKSLVERCNVKFDEQHVEDRRNQCARDLNLIVDRATRAIESGYVTEQSFAEAALRIVERVAEFEEIKTK